MKMLPKFLYPVYVYKNNLKSILNELSSTQWKDAEDIKALQRGKLRALLEHCFDNVPYYQKLFKKSGISKKDLSDKNSFRVFPILTKNLIRENLNELIAKNTTIPQLIQNSTSGSTGESLYFYNDTNSLLYRKAQVIVNKQWTNINWGDPVVRIWGAQMDIAKSKKLKNRVKNFLFNDLILSSFDLSDKMIENYAKLIQNFKPKLLISYPGPLEVFADYVKANSLIFSSLTAIISSAEQLSDYQRNVFEETFKVPVFNRYGSREFGDIAQECQYHNGLHLNTDRVYVEILDDYGNDVSHGNPGDLYITDLTNYGMPFVRYKICDRAVWSEIANCPCGRKLPMIQKLEGRSLDIIKTPNNRKLGGTYWTLLLRSKPGIRKFQIHQDKINSIKLFYVPDQNFSENILNHFEYKIKNICGQNFCIKFIKKDEISTTKSGKHRIIISDL